MQVKADEGAVSTLPINWTYSIPLSNSWDPKSVQATQIAKDQALSYNKANLWSSFDNSSFFSFNGDLPSERTDQEPPKTAEIWKLTPDGQGGAEWSLYAVTPSSIIGSVWVGSTVANGSVYLLGGIQDEGSTQNSWDNPGSVLSADGLVSYNITAGTWLNQSITYSYPSGWIFDTQLYHLAGIGNDQDLLLSMGGQSAPPGYLFSVSTFVEYDTVSIYNTVTNEWRNQTPTGDIPLPRGAACSVGVPGDNGTYEVY